MNIDLRKYCEYFGFTENHDNESILILNSCSSNLNIDKDKLDSTYASCNELYIGNIPRSIIQHNKSNSKHLIPKDHQRPE